MKKSSLCYIEKDGKYLMLHRVKKENDANKDKWIGIGGKFEDGESPEECMRREALEETGLTLHDLRMVRGKGHTNLIFDIALPEELQGRIRQQV